MIFFHLLSISVQLDKPLLVILVVENKNLKSLNLRFIEPLYTNWRYNVGCCYELCGRPCQTIECLVSESVLNTDWRETKMNHAHSRRKQFKGFKMHNLSSSPAALIILIWRLYYISEVNSKLWSSQIFLQKVWEIDFYIFLFVYMSHSH